MLIVSRRRQQPQLGGILSIRTQSVVQRWDGRWEQLQGQLCAHRDVGRRTPAVSRPGQGRVPESGQGECHAASFFPRLLPPASGAEMQIGDAGGGRGGAGGAGWGGARSLIPFTEVDTFTACSLDLHLTFTGCRRRGAERGLVEERRRAGWFLTPLPLLFSTEAALTQ